MDGTVPVAHDSPALIPKDWKKKFFCPHCGEPIVLDGETRLMIRKCKPEEVEGNSG